MTTSPRLDSLVRSALPGLRFPALPAAEVLPRYALFNQLESSQWLAPEALAERQFVQIDILLEHVRATVPAYRPRLEAAGLRPGRPCTTADWARLPLTTRRDLQSDGPRFVSQQPPPEHGALNRSRTSGSTGEPVEVLRSALDRLLWEAITLRDHAWHDRDLSGTLCVIRAGLGQVGVGGASAANWGPATVGLLDTGPCHTLPIATEIEAQAAWLRSHDPHCLLTYPTNLAALLDVIVPGALPRLREVRTLGETLPEELRDRVRERFGVPVVDTYSSNEVGYIALQCPHSGLYHVQSESLLVEVLDDAGLPCAPGQVGRVVVTTLHGFAQPLLRYELRDYAEVAPACSCGRGLPALRRIAGRSRNMLRLPDGSRRWPQVGFGEFRKIAPIRQYQLIQHNLEEVELRLVTDAPLSAGQEDALRATVRRKLAHPFAMRFEYFADALPVAPGGKFEEFVCRLG